MRRYMSKVVVLIIISILIWGCGKEDLTSGKTENKEVAGSSGKSQTPSVYKLKHCKTIGNNEEEKYVFIKIRDVKFDKDKNLYVADSKGHFLAKYNLSGKHMVRTGTSGQGPKEFLGLQSVVVTGDRIYAHDVQNHRISIYNRELEYLKARKVNINIGRLIHMDENGTGITTNHGSYGSGLGRVAMLNRKGELYRSCFNRHWFGEYVDGNKRDDYIKSKSTSVTAVYEDKSDKILIGFRESRNPTEIFILNRAGSIEKMFSYKGGKKYGLPELYYDPDLARKVYTSGNPADAESNDIRLDSLLIYRNMYFVFLKYQNTGIYHTITHKHLFLVFNKDGKLISETELKNDLTFFDISEDGYLAAADVEAEVPVVQVHKLVY